MLHIRNRMDAQRENWGVGGWKEVGRSFCGKRNSMHKRLNFRGALCENMTYLSEIWIVAWLFEIDRRAIETGWEGGMWKVGDAASAGDTE